MKKLDLLKAIFVASLEGQQVIKVGLLRTLDVPERELAKALGSLKKESLVEIGGRGVRLTPKGRRKLRVVFIGGTFEGKEARRCTRRRRCPGYNSKEEEEQETSRTRGGESQGSWSH